MQYAKTYLSIPAQAELLIQRGLECDRSRLLELLATVGYYRLSGYWYSFRRFHPTDRRMRLNEFHPGTTLDTIWNRYLFDRQLRLLVMDAIERLEVYLRAVLAHLHAEIHGPFEYATDSRTLPGLSAADHQWFRAELQDQMRRSEEGFSRHFRKNYSSHHNDLPIWMASELLTFGGLFTFYRGCEAALQQETARRLSIHDTVHFSWLKTLNVIRNTCAHHGRLWNRELSIKPKYPTGIRIGTNRSRSGITARSRF